MANSYVFRRLFQGVSFLLVALSLVSNLSFMQTASGPLPPILTMEHEMLLDNKKSKQKPQEHNVQPDINLLTTTRRAKYAIFIQMGTNFQLLDEMLQCTINVVKGIPDEEYIDIYMALLDREEQFQSEIQGRLSALSDKVNFVDVALTQNKGSDMGQFLTQLKRTQDNMKNSQNDITEEYKAILKIHAKSDLEWRERMLESLCGNANQVTAIINQLEANPHVDMVAALGTTFGPNTPIKQIYPRIIERYQMTSAEPAFAKQQIQQMEEVYTKLGFEGTMGKPKMVAGTCFWVRWKALQVDKWVSGYEYIYQKLTAGYVLNLGMEHVLERLFPTVLNGLIAEITPAPRVFPPYFPQYHAFPENDRFWGVNFTEWTLLKPMIAKKGAPPIRKPLSIEEGGLGYYNILDYQTRKRQAEMAKEYGVTGFMYYHYWFSGSLAPENHLVMTGLFDKLMEDGEPNLPFFMTWANEPWNRRWTGEMNGDVLLSQDYGEEDEWREHFMYLLQFFRLPIYEKIHGKPVFGIYRPGHVGQKFAPMIKLWREMAIEHGLPGLHIIQTIGNFYNAEKTYEVSNQANVDGSYHFMPIFCSSFASMPSCNRKILASQVDVNLGMNNPKHQQYWGSATGFDKRPRNPDSKPGARLHPSEFDKALKASFRKMSEHRGRNIGKNLFFVTAWNEWNEQAILEPDDLYKFRNLHKLHKNLRNLTVHVLNDL